MSDSEHEQEVNDMPKFNPELKEVSFGELLKLRDKFGKDYHDAIFENNPKKRKEKPKKPVAERKKQESDDDEPMEISSKKQVPVLGLEKSKKRKFEGRDPRFDNRCGKFNDEKFRGNYDFVFNIQKDEIGKLKEELRNPEIDDDRKQQIKFLIQRLTNKNRSVEEKKQKEEKLKQKRLQIQEARKSGKTPIFKNKKVEKTEELVKKFEELKESGKLTKYLEKRRKKNASKLRKKINS